MSWHPHWCSKSCLHATYECSGNGDSAQGSNRVIETLLSWVTSPYWLKKWQSGLKKIHCFHVPAPPLVIKIGSPCSKWKLRQWLFGAGAQQSDQTTFIMGYQSILVEKFTKSPEKIHWFWLLPPLLGLKIGSPYSKCKAWQWWFGSGA